MTCSIREVTQDELSKFFLDDPKLSYLGLPDLDLVHLYEYKKFPMHFGSTYVGVYIEIELICVIKYEVFTAETGDFHMYVSSKLHQTGITPELQKIIYKYFLDNTDFIKGIVMVPSVCEHVQKSALNFGWQLEGRLTKAMRWRKELVDILIYAIELKRDV